MGLQDLVHSLQGLDMDSIRNADIRDWRVQVAIATAALTTVYITRQLTKKRYKLPPGPRPLPFVGNLLSLRGEKKEIYEVFLDYVEKYGDVFTFHLGPVPTIVLNSPEAVRETLLEKGNDYANRPHSFSTDLFTEGISSLVFEDANPVWKVQRKIAHAALRKFASGSHLEGMLQSRSTDTVALMLKENGKPFDPLKYLTLMIYNTVVSMILSKTFDLEDEWYKSFIKETDELNESFNTGLWADAFPILAYFPSPTVRRIRKFMKEFRDFLAQTMQEHRDTFDPDDVSDFVYLILEAEKKAKEDPSEDKAAVRSLTDEHFFGVLSDIFFAGTDTSRTTLHWAIAYCVQYPEVQARMHKEIDDVIGPDGVIRLSDRGRLPYIEAVLHETLRIQPIVPLSLPHATACDTTLRDYTIPKGTQVMMNIWALHKNPKLWKDPEAFNPDRWLDEDGKHVSHPYQYLPFSTGRRVCVGESFAKIELHLYLAMLFQKLEFKAPQGKPFKVDRLPGFLISMPQPYEVIAVPRS